jgi:cytosine/adenosine deaminase-related metal-dependent hydrolase
MLVHPDGYILGVGTAASLEAQAQELLLTGAMQTVSKSSRDSRMRLVLKTLPQGSFLMPGFVDAHVHFLQVCPAVQIQFAQPALPCRA